MVESVKPKSKLTGGFPTMAATVQVHKRGPRHRQLKWIVENLIRAALVYGVNQALDYLKGLLQELLQRSLGNGRPKPKSRWDVHFQIYGNRLAGFAGPSQPLIAGRSGSAV